jgi:hypothetical protein
MRDTGWSEPFSTAFKIYWTKERAKRHLFFYLLSESSVKFQYKTIHLEHKFQHLEKLIKKMDEDFVKAIEENAAEFAGVDSFQLFGTYINSGFISEEQTGRDLTYDSENLIDFSPKEND